MDDKIYIVISQTGTILSRILKHLTGKEYNHISIGLSRELNVMYSFGRLNAYNPFWGGFVIESPHSGTFKRFFNTKVIVLSLNIGIKKYGEILKMITDMEQNRKKYRYNYLGLLFAKFNIPIKFENRYYCSEFVKELLVINDVSGAECIEKIPHPMSFLNFPAADVIYKGKLHDYSAELLECN